MIRKLKRAVAPLRQVPQIRSITVMNTGQSRVRNFFHHFMKSFTFPRQLRHSPQGAGKIGPRIPVSHWKNIDFFLLSCIPHTLVSFQMQEKALFSSGLSF